MSFDVHWNNEKQTRIVNTNKKDRFVVINKKWITVSIFSASCDLFSSFTPVPLLLRRMWQSEILLHNSSAWSTKIWSAMLSMYLTFMSHLNFV